MSDPKQSIYDAMNWLGSVIPQSDYDDGEHMLDALLSPLNDQAVVGLVKLLRARNRRLSIITKAWEDASQALRNACLMIDGKPTTTVIHKGISV